MLAAVGGAYGSWILVWAMAFIHEAGHMEYQRVCLTLYHVDMIHNLHQAITRDPCPQSVHGKPGIPGCGSFLGCSSAHWAISLMASQALTPHKLQPSLGTAISISMLSMKYCVVGSTLLILVAITSWSSRCLAVHTEEGENILWLQRSPGFPEAWPTYLGQSLIKVHVGYDIQCQRHHLAVFFMLLPVVWLTFLELCDLCEWIPEMEVRKAYAMAQSATFAASFEWGVFMMTQTGGIW